ncbi:MAG: hypothetical protein ERJ67_07685 [Aphanocapsa feldmannii 277cV]|uniref:Leucine-rich repeat domain-containing protein n=1 Tax=Aphanocapsa feldmannii 277cV TaxID=2507553 RepID=A0A524RMF7_9CHRO|nr:MAG: hypothetical protein ERJ67_07685 [Aphanocapsa feldmannii 277cV]
MPLNKISRILMPALLSLSTASFSFAVQAAERGRIRSLQGNADLLQRNLALGMGTPTFVNGAASDSAVLDNNMNNLEGLHISQNRLSAPKSERDVLIEFYDATNGDNWKSSYNNGNWKSNKPLSEWYGVTTDSSGRVTKLELGWRGLTGSIPAALGKLNNLKELRLNNNRLMGSIPAALGKLNNLEILWLEYNELTGSIPAALGKLNNLENLYLRGNELTGSIPAALANVRYLGVDVANAWKPKPKPKLKPKPKPKPRQWKRGDVAYICGTVEGFFGILMHVSCRVRLLETPPRSGAFGVQVDDDTCSSNWLKSTSYGDVNWLNSTAWLDSSCEKN